MLNMLMSQNIRKNKREENIETIEEMTTTMKIKEVDMIANTTEVMMTGEEDMETREEEDMKIEGVDMKKRVEDMKIEEEEITEENLIIKEVEETTIMTIIMINNSKIEGRKQKTPMIRSMKSTRSQKNTKN
jgi:adenine-specific DNA methylase